MVSRHPWAAQGSDTGITLEENVLANTRLAIAVLGSTQVTATGNVCTDAANPSVTDGLCQGAGWRESGSRVGYNRRQQFRSH